MTKRRPTTRKTAFFNQRRTPHLEILENRRLLTASSESPNVAISSINQYGTVLFGQDWQDDLGINAAQIQQHIQADTWRSALNDSSAATISQIRQEAQYLGAETLQSQIDSALEAANLPTIDVREFDWLQERNVGPAAQADYFADGEILDEMLAEGEGGTERKFYIRYQEYDTYEGHLINAGQDSTLTIHIGYTGDYVEGGFSVGWNATNGTASAGSDFTPASGTVNFTDTAEGEQAVNLTIINDTIDELDETFTIQVGSPDGARGSTEVTIWENDLHVAIFDADPVTEEDEPTPWVIQMPQSRFRVTISSPRSEAVSIPWRSTVAAPPYNAEQLAYLGPDYYHMTSGVPDVHHWVTFNPGETEKFIEIGVVSDRLYELTEYFFVDIATDWLHHIQYTVDDQRATGTIIDNDPFPELAIDDVTVEETDDTATLTVTMTNRSSFPVTFDWALADQSATRPEDYDHHAASGTVTIPSGGGPDPHLEYFTFQIINDFLTEPDETFRLTISNAVNANITKATGVVTILANDPQVDIDVDSNNNGAITQADDPIETDAPGKFVPWNRDDDDDNGQPDYLDAGPLQAADNDLVPVNLAFIQNGLPQSKLEKLRVRISGNTGHSPSGYYSPGSIKLWDSVTKNNLIEPETTWQATALPGTLYMESVSSSGAAGLVLVLEEIEEESGAPGYSVSLVHFDYVQVTSVTPTVTITQLEVVDTLDLNGQPIYPGNLDESEILVVHGIIRGVWENDVVGGFVGLDLNLDGDFDDLDERVAIQGVGLETSFSKIFHVKDDGIVTSGPGNLTEMDLLQIKVEIISQFGGEAETYSSIEVHNIEASFEEYPRFEFVLAADGLTVESAKITGKIYDPGWLDYHKITVALPFSFFPIAPITLHPSVRTFSIDIPLAGTHLVGDFSGIQLAMGHDDWGIDEYGLTAVSITAKSFINGSIGENGEGIGSFPNGDNYPSALSASARLIAFAGSASVYQENPQPPNLYSGTLYTGESYRLFSRVNVQFGYQNGKIVSIDEIGATILDGGSEGPLFDGTINIRGLQFILNPNGTANVRWMGYGRPDSDLEWSFNQVANRNAKYIWHLVNVTASVANGSLAVIPQLRGSKFPSHRIWVNTALSNNISQSQLVNLWEEMRLGTIQELSQLLNVPMASFAEFVTEEEDGDYTSQATPDAFLPVFGSWDPEGQ